MRSTRLVLAVAVLLGSLAPSLATAQHVELAGRVTASRTVLSQRRVGEARYVAISDLFYSGRSAFVEVLDLQTRAVIQVAAKRSLLERRYGIARGGSVAVPQGEVAVYRGGVVGIALVEAAVNTSRRHWYVELDSTGKLVRSAGLATLRDGEQLEIIGADPAGSAVWFAITRRAARGRTLVLRRLDLDTLEAQDEQQITLAARADHGREHAVRVRAAADFSRFAIVEYVEDGVRMAPGQVFIADPATGGSFAVP
ncbi:MAG TPA: hypothetical protein VK607_24480, partial [Kofleriaceae bacterium]|nr:hypothetical protein [Kofleriaceae bacterium]